jgi:AraC-like DNA-binding protein
MAYRELPPPSGPSATHLACRWMRDAGPGRTVHRVLPDACVDVVWIASGRLVVAGPATGPVLSEVPADTAAAGVRFRVGAAGSALGLPACELLDATVALEDLWGADGARLAERLYAAPGPEAMLAELTNAVVQRLPPPAGLDRAVRAAAVGAARPDVRVRELADRVGVSERQLRRRFAAAVGYGPKTLQRVLRFQRFLALARREPGLPEAWPFGPETTPAPTDLARLALDAGYADQAHLTRECRRLAGVTPTALMRARAGPAGEPSDPFKTRAGEAARLAA